MNYRKVNVDRLIMWLQDNKTEFTILPAYPADADPNERIIGTLDFYVEVYTPHAETAVRIKWNTE